MIDFARNHFELLGLPARYAIDVRALEDAYRTLQRAVHPDRHAASDDATRRLSLQAASRVNEAYRTLADPVERARYLLSLKGVDAFDESDTALAFDFLERQLDRRERAELAATARDEPALESLLGEVRREAAATESVVAALLDSQGALPEARERLRELKFLDRLAGDVDAMLAEAGP
ncbi:Co-chaperone protein HscB [Burkholderiales bacterium]|nr:Co-chaperone protein HscB [Burkholderiales bacterium]